MTQAHARIPCPFGPCTARPEVLPMRGLSLETPAVELIREHAVDPDSWFGLCPASNQQYPPLPRLVELLGEQELTLLTLRAERARAAAQTEHGIEQQPDRPRQGYRTGGSSPQWFKNSEQGDPRDRGPLGRPRLTVVPDPAPDRKGGASVPSTADVKAAISRANQQIAEGMEQARQTQEKFEEARTTINFVRETSVDPLGGPQVASAIDSLETVQQLAHVAIENNSAYSEGL